MRKLLFFLFTYLISWSAFSQSFSPPDYLCSTPFELRSALLLDVDGDGDLDAISAGIGFNTSGMETWLNEDGTFVLETDNIPFSQFGSYNLQSGDLDLDGDEDLITVIEGNLAWFSNNGQGQFANPQIIGQDYNDVRSIEVAELNNEPGPELLLTRIDLNEVLAFANDGEGNFGDPVSISTSTTDAIDALAADLNGDGLNDVIAACLNGCDVTWHENLGDMTFGPKVVLTEGQVGTYKLGVADFDQNGHMDIASVGFGSDDLSIFFNSGSGSFGSRVIVSDQVDGATNLAVGDFNDDGSIDLCVGAENIPYPIFFEGNGSGEFTEIPMNQTGGVANPEAYLTGDVDNDGKIDLVTASQNDNKLSWYRQMEGVIADGTVPFHPQFIMNKPSPGANGLAPLDLNEDGLIDLIASEPGAGRLTWYEQLANGDGLGEQQILLELSEGISGISSGDMNGDGLQDLVVSNIGDSTVTVFFKLEGTIAFTELLLDQELDEPYRPVLKDLDNDGDLDVMVAVGWETSVYIYPNNGDGSFGMRMTLCDNCSFARALNAEDLNNDGLPEVMVYFGSFQEIKLFENLGGLNFSAPTPLIDGFNGARDIEFIDFDNDGDLDVFATAIYDNRINYAENLGNLDFAPEAEVPFNFWGAYDLVAFDADLDGDLDLGVTEFFANQIKVVFVEDGAFPGGINVDTPYENPNALLAGDFNGDGSFDLVACFRNYVALYENEAKSCSALKPENLTVDITGTSVVFSWDPIPETEGCRVTVQNTSTQQLNGQNVFGTAVSSLTAPIGFFEPDQGYNWKVQCACSLNPLEKTGSTTDYFSMPPSIMAYPNPTGDQVQVSFTDGGSAFGKPYGLWDIQGRLLEQGIYQGPIDLQHLAVGFYVLKCEGMTTKFYKE